MKLAPLDSGVVVNGISITFLLQNPKPATMTQFLQDLTAIMESTQAAKTLKVQQDLKEKEVKKMQDEWVKRYEKEKIESDKQIQFSRKMEKIRLFTINFMKRLTDMLDNSNSRLCQEIIKQAKLGKRSITLYEGHFFVHQFKLIWKYVNYTSEYITLSAYGLSPKRRIHAYQGLHFMREVADSILKRRFGNKFTLRLGHRIAGCKLSW